MEIGAIGVAVDGGWVTEPDTTAGDPVAMAIAAGPMLLIPPTGSFS
ncbi:hypothetical protein [Paractinoplanes brasiliensis]|uniref:Uncharacterized protein n=1 Tax=Paractinoplanes brasiliensis TaxID=52695 RepID=A0A4R6JA82_9ACTN|nr:hypothetical protein [Actinoplanes brasiliensis]TDO32157.1 hypothetical protein C8E87_7603 [Actinoplanes brasiliensis]GID28211.1 hypothetical protein Abr02nite_31940 [Actinoplanes brasiliensis]